MLGYYKTIDKSERWLFWFAIAIILLGIVLRLMYWTDNRDLIIDEANIARNLFERDFGQLTTRLNYEQYAPVLFLWIEKLFTTLFGFSEQSLRGYPLLCGIGALFVFMLVLREYMSLKSLWYPLLYLAVSHVYARYSTETKQYMPDILIVLSLTLFALKTDILTHKKSTFFFKWLIVGSIATWASMPCIFALVGVGAYYLVVCIQNRKPLQLLPFAAAALVCAMQFGLYYFTVLQQDAHSEYLQGFHQKFFLVGIPVNAEEWRHNYYVITDLIKTASGWWKPAIVVNFSLLLIGLVVLVRKSTAKTVLIIVPVLVTFVAAAMHEFSLIPRVVLFTTPVFLLLIGVGLDAVIRLNFKVLNVAVVCLCFYAVYLHHDLKRLTIPFYSEQITWAMQMMKDNGIKKDDLVISHGSEPAFLYYTTIHPDQQRWISLKGAPKTSWDANWSEISEKERGRFGVIFSTIATDEAHAVLGFMEQHSRLLKKIEEPEAKTYAYILERKSNP